MQLFITVLASCGVLFQGALGVPVSYYPHQYSPQVYGHYVGSPCIQQGYLCSQTRVVPAVSVPILRQKFVTTTRKHDNLNTAKASNKKSARVKYQDGPSAEIEGEQTASVYAKKRSGDHAFNPVFGQEQFGQVLPYTQTEPIQSEQSNLSIEQSEQSNPSIEQ
ncbi:hypothetical protein K7432_015617 [Basidiobolus ranarum]|uniref:Uncharacterized protein n=1 Tax=Basidiobolus ranarum TaxID=34480 RepID=A0ABR2VN13_9FUNG